MGGLVLVVVEALPVEALPVVEGVMGRAPDVVDSDSLGTGYSTFVLLSAPLEVVGVIGRAPDVVDSEALEGALLGTGYSTLLLLSAPDVVDPDAELEAL